MWWSWLLTSIGLTGLWLVTRTDRRGFLVGVGVQVLWIVYAVTTGQWGFIVSALAYGALNARGWALWARKENVLLTTFDRSEREIQADAIDQLADDMMPTASPEQGDLQTWLRARAAALRT